MRSFTTYTLDDGAHYAWAPEYKVKAAVSVSRATDVSETGRTVVYIEVRNSQGYTLIPLLPSEAAEVGQNLLRESAIADHLDSM